MFARQDCRQKINSLICFRIYIFLFFFGGGGISSTHAATDHRISPDAVLMPAWMRRTVNQVAVKNMSHGQTNNALVAGGNVVRIGIIRRKGGVVMNTAMDDTVKGNITVASVPASVPAASSGRPAIAVGVPGEKWV